MNDDNNGDDDNDDGDNDNLDNSDVVSNQKLALRHASSHFHPYRQVDKVTKKWERSLNPRITNKQFTPEEDARLLEIVKKSAAAKQFGEIAKEHFPGRTRDQVYRRWVEIAPPEDVVEKYKPTLVHQGIRKELLADGNNKEGDGTSTGNGDSTALFQPDDFVVEILPDNNEK